MAPGSSEGDHHPGLDVRPFGRGRLSAVSAGTMSIHARVVAPASMVESLGPLSPHGRFPAGLTCLIAEIGGAVVVVDPMAFASGDPATPPDYLAGAGLDTALAALGLDPSEVDHVVFTHRHADHVSGAIDASGVPRFPGAKHWLGRADWDSLGSLADYDGETVLRALWDRGLLHLNDGAAEIVAGVQVMPAPGETPGHRVVRFTDGENIAYYLGDLIHHEAQVELVEWAPLSRDPELVRQSRLHVLGRMIEDNAVGLFSHADFPGWGSPSRSGASFVWHPRTARHPSG